MTVSYCKLKYVEKYGGEYKHFSQSVEEHGYLAISPKPSPEFAKPEIGSGSSVSMSSTPKAHEPKSGRCMGIALTYCERLISPYNYFQFPNKDGFYSFNNATSSVKQIVSFSNLQKRYGEIDTARKKMVQMGFSHQYSSCDFSKTEFTTHDLQPMNLDRLLEIIRYSTGQILFFTLHGHGNTPNSTYIEFFHANVIRKTPENSSFFDPNLGEASFSDWNNFANWLKAETSSGALSLFTKENQIKNDGTTRVYDGYILDVYRHPCLP